MNKYERIIYWSDDDNKYIVEVPELSGCMADGETIEEANASRVDRNRKNAWKRNTES